MLPPHTPLIAQLADPAFHIPFLLCCLLQPIAYFGLTRIFPKHFTGVKQRAWILTLLSSLVMTVASIPFIVDFMMHPESLRTAPCMRWDSAAKAICAFFVSYCLGDLVLGHFLYPSEMNPWSGYFHHTLYTFMVTNLVQRGLGSAFVIFGVLEAPTLLMALGSIHKPLRHDKLFGAVFFTTRLAFHVYLTIHLGFFAYPGTLTFMYPLGVLPLHVMWFNGWIKQQRRLHKAKLAAAAATAAGSTTASTIVSPSTPTAPTAAPAPTKPATPLRTRTEAYRKAALALKDRLTPKHRRPQRHAATYYGTGSGAWPTSATVPPSLLEQRRASVSALATGAPASLKSGMGVGAAAVERAMQGGAGLKAGEEVLA
ncbi:hypothetical protein HDU96_002819 [Phlyctochytrium bullatum]|nr:hypothetical protein HDU96_002819 [Phlyctochytrium bullatum]